MRRFTVYLERGNLVVVCNSTRLAVFGLTSYMFVNKHSDFLALGFFTGVDAIGTLGLLSMTHY